MKIVRFLITKLLPAAGVAVAIITLSSPAKASTGFCANQRCVSSTQCGFGPGQECHLDAGGCFVKECVEV